MKKVIFIIAVLVTAIFTSCSKDDDSNDSVKSDADIQTEAYINITSNIVGKWYATEIYNDGSYSDYYNEPIGWCKDKSTDLLYIIFNADGTYTEKTPLGIESGTYNVYKNSEYSSNKSITLPVFVDLKGSIDTTTRGITISNGYLTIYGILSIQGIKTVDFKGYPANYRYTKQ